MNRVTPEIEILIYRFLRGVLSTSEREKLDRWLREGKHQAWFDRICDREELFKKSLRLDRLNQNKTECWKYLERQTGLRGRRVARRWMVAASVVIPFLICLLLFTNERGVMIAQAPVSGPIVPGVKTAQLRLSDGKVVLLCHDSTRLLVLASGDVLKNEDGTLTYQPDRVNEGVPQYSEIEIPRGGEYKVVLPDGTSVWLNAESSLRFPDVFAGNERRVYASGELYFEVARDERKPFRIEVEGGYTIEVLGTEFNLRAYGASPCVTTLIRGSVLIKGEGHDVLLAPGEQAVENEGRTGIDVKEVDVRPYVAWREGFFLFRQARLEDILTELARWYDVQVFFENQEVRDERFSIEMKRFEDFNRVLKLIERTGTVKMTVNGHMVIVK